MNYKKKEKDGVTFLTFPLLEKEGIVHGFSTKIGGVSTGDYASMNLSFQRGDNPEAVMENHRRLAKAVGYDCRNVVFSDQVHETEMRRVYAEDAGKGIFVKSDIRGVDGLITNDKNVVLMTFFADCVPLFFYDKEKRAIGASHSGWRGTVKRMGEQTVKAMAHEFDSRPEDILAVIGPSICRDCYEVGQDVADAVYRAFDKKWHGQILFPDNATEGTERKYHLDLWRANEIILREAGLPEENIGVSGLCTCCHSDLLFSHRATVSRRGIVPHRGTGKRGNLAGVITLGE